jgi:hypothetical protein
MYHYLALCVRQLLKAGVVDVEVVWYKACVTAELVSSVNTTDHVVRARSEGTGTKFQITEFQITKILITKFLKLPSSYFIMHFTFQL